MTGSRDASATTEETTGRRYRVAMVCSHAIQYLVPWFVQAGAHPRLDLTVLLGDAHGLSAGHDPEFGQSFRWDIDLATGYRRILLPNQALRPGVGRFFGVASLAVFDELRAGRYDAVVIQGWNYALYPLALLAARRAGIPVLMRAESMRLPDEPGVERTPRRLVKELVKESVLRRYLGACAGALAVSSGNRRLLAHYGMPAERIFASPYAVDGTRFQLPPAERQAARQRLRAQLGLAGTADGEGGTPLLLYCGKLIPVKEPQLLLSAYAALRRSGVAATLVLAGDGPLRPELEEWVRAHAVPDVHFLGFKNQSELPALYAAADALVLPSQRETFGIVVVEAQNAGLPVIASDGVGCAEDLVLPPRAESQDSALRFARPAPFVPPRGDEPALPTGLTFRRGDAAGLIRCLETLCSGAGAEDLRRKLAVGARRRAASWTYAAATAGLVQALDALGLPGT